ncbi:MAG TPA: hypothetical protein VNK04_09625 [Gemmataceae bacterium]|nr:hypothetical protein [Gemmataceae bacterium]
MAGTQHPHVDPKVIEQTRRHINRLREEVARLSEMDLAPADYFGEFLTRVLQALAAPAGAVWTRTPHGNLQLQAQVQMQKVGLDRSDAAKEQHGELLRQAVQQARPLCLQPQSSVGTGQVGAPAPGNPTDYLLLLAPIMMGNQVQGLIEVWQDPNRHPSAIQGFLQFLVHMGELASRYLRNRLLGEMIGQQELWTKMELFARQIHESLNPVEVAYRVANEGRRLIDCDRVSVGVRYGKRVVVEAVSGADVVEKRSNLVQRMRKLFDRVLAWGEKLVYTGTKDDSLPPEVLQALDAYLEESASKLLCIIPLRDERETTEENKPRKPPRSVLMMECFEPAAAPEQLIARQEVLARHAASALYNAVEHRRIPFRFIWMPIARVQEGLGGKTRAILWGIAAALLILIGVLYFVPYPLKMDATGQLLPEERYWVYSPTKGHVVRFNVDAGQEVGEHENLVLMFDRELKIKLENLQAEVRGAQNLIDQLTNQLTNANNPIERTLITTEIEKQKAVLDAKSQEYNAWVAATNSVPGRPGYFWLRSPRFPEDSVVQGNPRWTVLSWDYKERLTDAEVKPSDPLLRLGYREGPWEVVLKIPQKHIGQVLQAFDRADRQKREELLGVLEAAAEAGTVSKEALAEMQALPLRDLQERMRGLGVLKADQQDLLKESELEVDLLVKSAPTEVFKGKLTRSKLAGAADQHRDENNEAEPVVVARVRISGDDIPAEKQIPQRLLLADTQVNAKVRCGHHRMGYSLFYGVWEFFYEKVVFFF